MNLFYRTTRGAFKTFFSLFHQHEVHGAEHLPEGPALIAANHTSYLDPPLICASASFEFHYLARASLFEYPLFSRLIRSLNAHPVAGGASDLSSFKLIAQLIKDGKKVVIFPEGSRSADGELLPFKAGIGMLALRTEAPIIPTYIEGLHAVWPIGKRFPHLFGKTRIFFGNAIHPQNYANLDKKEAQAALANDVHDAILKLKNTY